jgi:hypothetical protein
MPLKVYLGTDSSGTLLAASNIKVINILDAKDSMSFSLDGATACSMYEDIYCEYDDGATTEGVFIGFIESISVDVPRVITCLGLAGKMSWWIVPQGASKTIQDEGVVDAIHALDDNRLDLNDSDGVAMTGLSQYANIDADNPDYYLLVADGTKGPATQVCQNGANDWIGYASATNFENVLNETDYTDINRTSAGGDDFALRSTDTDEYFRSYSTISLDVQNYDIPDSVTITNIRIGGRVVITVDNCTSQKVYTRAELALGTTAGSYQTIALSQPVLNKNWPAGDASIGFTFNWTGRWADLRVKPFTSVGGEWSGGKIMVSLISWRHDYATFYEKPSITLTWKYLNCEFDYGTATFEPSNAAIVDADDPNEIETAVDYNALGVAPGDKWAIGVDYNKALLQAFTYTDLPENLIYAINEGAYYGKGIAKNFYGCTCWEMVTQLIKDVQHHIWTDNHTKSVIIGGYSNMGDSITLDSPGRTSEATVNQYPPAQVAVIWKDGIEFASTGVEGAKGVMKISDEGIITQAEAETQAALAATDAAEIKYSVECKYAGTALVANGAIPRVGRLYDLTYTKKDGTTHSFTDEPARYVSIFNNGGDEHYNVSVSLGRGSTPYHEKVPKMIMENRNAIAARQFKAMSSTYTPAKRHSALNGVAGSTDQYHVSSSQYANLLVHGDVDDVSVNGADDVPISSNWAYDHENNTTTAHGAVSTNTASKLVVRDANARAQFGDPAAAQDAVTLNYYRYPPKRGLIELIQNEETNTQNIVYSGYQPFADNDTDTGFWRCVMPPDLKAGGKVSLWLILSNDHASGKKITFNQIGLCAAPKNGTFFTYLNDWNGGAADYIKLTTTLDGSVTVKAEHFEVLTDNTGFAAYDAVWLKLIRNASNADDDWGATCYVRAYLTYERDLVGS